MKLTDFAIVFSLVFICLIVILGYKLDYSCVHEEQRTELNNILDCAIQDSMEATFLSVDNEGKPNVNKEQLLDTFIRQVSFECYGSMNDLYLSKVRNSVEIFIYTEDDCFYEYYKGGWSDKIEFISDEHSVRVSELLKEVNAKLADRKVFLDLPVNDGENYKQTVNCYGAYSVYRMNNFNDYIFSGAAIKNIATPEI